jgi:hemerythrin-like domain-containing protein
MDLFDTPAGFDDPIAMWTGCHRRIEKQLATLARLAAHVAAKGVDPEASAAALAIMRYFERSGPHHHEDEDRDLFPLIEQRVSNTRDLLAFRELRSTLEGEHRAMHGAWARIRKPLQAIAEGIPKPLPVPDVEAFRAIYAKHIPAEDEAVPELVRRYLSSADLETLGRSMAARRGVAFPS